MQSHISMNKTFTCSAEQLWPFLSDTATMNRKLNLSPMTFTTINGVRHGQQKILFLNTFWTEKPWEWIHGQWLSNERVYSKGLFNHIRSKFSIHSTDSGCSVCIEFQIEHRYPFLTKILNAATRSVVNKIFEYLETCSSLSAPKVSIQPPKEIELEDWLSDAHEVDRARIEPKFLAKSLNSSWQKVLLKSQSKKYNSRFSILFDIKCPHCRGSMASAPKLTELPKRVDCPSCDINIDPNSSENLSLTLRDTSLPISLNGVDFCSSDVSHKPMVVFQRMGQDWKFNTHLNDGLYILKRRGYIEAVKIHIASSFSCVNFNFESSWSELSSSTVELNSNVTFSGAGLEEKDLIFLEFLSSDSGSLSLAEALLDYEVSDLLPSSKLSSDFPIEIGYKTLLFTDVVGSTDLYYEVGDTEAFSRIRASFLHIGKVCNKYKALLVKTIGDATMYAFHSPLDAIQASIELQQTNPKENLRLRISLHSGQCLSISTADGLDFFGDTVNICAKFQAVADANEIVFDSSLINSQTSLFYKNIESQTLDFELKGKNKRTFNLLKLKVY